MSTAFDPGFAAARPDDALTETISKPGLRLAEVVWTVTPTGRRLHSGLSNASRGPIPKALSRISPHGARYCRSFRSMRVAECRLHLSLPLIDHNSAWGQVRFARRSGNAFTGQECIVLESAAAVLGIVFTGVDEPALPSADALGLSESLTGQPAPQSPQCAHTPGECGAPTAVVVPSGTGRSRQPMTSS